MFGKKSKGFYVEMYQDFKKIREFYFKDQLLRPTLLISNNIAEGHDRHTDKEYLRFLYFAKGSASEVHSMLGGLIRTIYKSLKARG